MILISILRPLRPWRPFDLAQDMLCGKYSEIQLQRRHAGALVVNETGR
jgi:hypothetical protein